MTWTGAQLCGLLGLLVLAGCGPAGGAKGRVDTAKIVDSIKTDEVHWNADYRAGDAAKIVAHYAPHATLMMPGATPAQGPDAIGAVVGKMMAAPGFALSFASDKVDVAASGDLAVTRGHYKLTTNDAKTGAPSDETGVYVTVYKPRPDGTWKATWDIIAPGPAGH
jgi:ketosteroid isomerase-like protein